MSWGLCHLYRWINNPELIFWQRIKWHNCCKFEDDTNVLVQYKPISRSVSKMELLQCPWDLSSPPFLSAAKLTQILWARLHSPALTWPPASPSLYIYPTEGILICFIKFHFLTLASDESFKSPNACIPVSSGLARYFVYIVLHRDFCLASFPSSFIKMSMYMGLFS